jgi:hypothetical protein
MVHCRSGKLAAGIPEHWRFHRFCHVADIGLFFAVPTVIFSNLHYSNNVSLFQ